ncbi:hypothetical protein BOW53_06795 [Solemya pervernicosa gill symbiont]|uniref:histidine kinase n=1 Tax=Solemya pervernicosa gill symbiont TaxID=642797 RepID=A0A1T2L6M7_9GAMM|nr:response regulator [Solemya pervernicosa gill symbiont]OOZ40710.1 hypothetical protein BOW53_06795 [Solemya pervernicosa gill symbiont]
MKNNRILIVDDEQINYQLIEAMLITERYECFYAENGKKALLAIERYNPGLMLVDVMMPDMDGYELTERVKGNPALSDIPIILVTTLSDRESRLRGFNSGAEEFISKPVDKIELLCRIRNLMRLKEMIDKAKLNSEALEAEVTNRTNKLQASHSELEHTHNELKQTQQKMVHSEKMAAIGQLSAGVAHEINNPVGYINSNLNTLESYIKDLMCLLSSYEHIEKLLPENHVAVEELLALKREIDLGYLSKDIAEIIKDCQHGAERVKEIVRDLKDFAHPDMDDWQWANLHSGIDSTINVVWNELKYKVEVIKEYGDVPNIECLPSQLNQVWMNLLVNASHAIEERGVIIVRTGMVDEERLYVEMEDDGSGMDPAYVDKIFDPFFTTKPLGKGTGLGLSIAFGIIEKHRGSVGVDSELGRGTCFRIELPISHVQHDKDSGAGI